MNIFSWDDWGDVSDRFPGHPESIDTIVTLTDEVILTGSSDGLIRVINIHPNKLLGVIGEHDEFPVERLSLSRDESFLASCSHDCTVKARHFFTLPVSRASFGILNSYLRTVMKKRRKKTEKS